MSVLRRLADKPDPEPVAPVAPMNGHNGHPRELIPA